MTRHLVLSIRFLDDRYHGLTDKGDKSEWPPSPFRLFQAMVAGNARGQEIPEQIKKALCWLESLDPPVITAPEAKEGRTLLTYVLNVVSDNPKKNQPIAKTTRPMLLHGDRLVQYAWAFEPTTTSATEHAKTIAQAARHIRCLGWGIDLAIGCGEVVQTMPSVSPPRIAYRPCPGSSRSGVVLRAPKTGSLLSLERCHTDFLRRYELPGITQLGAAGAIYEQQPYVAGAHRPYVAFLLKKGDDENVSIRHQLIAPLVGMIRKLASSPHVIQSLGQEVVNRDIMGHPKDGSACRVSILQLPTIRKGPTDGRIRRVLLAQPFATGDTLCRSLGQLFNSQKLTPLNHEDRFKDIYLQRTDKHDPVLPRYVGISRVWASVTPVLLPGYDDRKVHHGDHQKRLARAKQLVRKAITQAGINIPAEIELSRVPWWTGALHAKDYQPRTKLAHYPRWHVQLTFD